MEEKEPYWKKRARVSPDKVREAKRRHHLKKKYGITLEQFDKYLVDQRYRCAICTRLLDPRKTCVDHCHETDFVRGLLCHSCNNGIGLLRESKWILAKAATYLEEARERERIRRRHLTEL